MLVALSMQAQFAATVIVEDIPNNKGTIAIAIYNNAEKFLDDEYVIAGTFVAAKKGTITYRFENLKQGTYAVAVYHDEDKSKTLSSNLFGIPKEAYGFSNNPSSRFSAPKFAECAVLVEKDITITVRVD